MYKMGQGTTSLLGWLALALLIAGAVAYFFNTFDAGISTPAPAPEDDVVGGGEYGIP